MPPTTFLLYILSQALNSLRPMLILRLREWYEKFQTEPAAIEPRRFCHDVGLKPEEANKFCSLYTSQSPDQLESELQRHGIRAINMFEDDYPELLREITDPPLVLYYRGNVRLLNADNPIAMVGSRRATSYGESITAKLLNELSCAPVVIISGLAYGIDSYVHKAALKNSLKTIAVLGSGIDDSHIFPRENFTLAQDILSSAGLLVSEYPPGTNAQKFQFVARNRIIAGLSKVVVILEAAEKSGALITASFAADYNRAVLAVPGSILSPTSLGALKLMQSGAGAVLNGADIANELGLKLQEQQAKAVGQLAEPEARVLKYIQHEAIEFDSLIEQSGLCASEMQAVLADLELKNVIKQTAPQVYQKIV